jgi:PKD repeat protein
VFQWDFGDGSPIVTTTNATHTFPSSGQFKTLLTITDAVTGCVDTFSTVIYTSTPTLENNDAVICKNTNTSFTILNSYSNPAATYTWDIVGRPKVTTKVPAAIIKASVLGDFRNYVIIKNGTTAQYCSDTLFLNHNISVRGPNLDFIIPPSICFSNPCKCRE